MTALQVGTMATDGDLDTAYASLTVAMHVKLALSGRTLCILLLIVGRGLENHLYGKRRHQLQGPPEYNQLFLLVTLLIRK